MRDRDYRKVKQEYPDHEEFGRSYNVHVQAEEVRLRQESRSKFEHNDLYESSYKLRTVDGMSAVQSVLSVEPTFSLNEEDPLLNL